VATLLGIGAGRLAGQCGPVLGQRCAIAAISSARHDSAAHAFAAGLMDLSAAAVDHFATAHPGWDGRGVLIAILDSGIDPGIPGLGVGADSAQKILDLRDFSGEGRTPLTRLVRRGDTLVLGSHRILGATTIASQAGTMPIWGGLVIEAALGRAPAADLNGNGSIDDSLLVVVAHTPSGWALYADTRGVGTLAGETPVHDYAVAHEYFGWHPLARDGHTLLPSPVNLAVNFADSAAAPLLDLFFDTSSHGTHVSGIAAGHDLYGVAGFDGVAPGARLIGLKIADDGHGAVSTTGSMARALSYAIAFAHDRNMPLVVNLSFGVGNDVEGTARIDAMVDSMLAAHPDVVMMVAAGNDGPGLSTLGFPGSAGRIVSVGATVPLTFMGAPPGYHGTDPVASFSSRGGEHAGPDLVTPGAAYSSVPNYAAGDEQEEGTSMAAPYASGLAARLMSALLAAHRTVPGYVVTQALRSSSVPIAGDFATDQGAGVPNLVAAWQWLTAQHVVTQIGVDIGTVHGRGGVFLTAGSAALGARVQLHVLAGPEIASVTLRPSATWIHVPETVAIVHGAGEFTVQVPAEAAAEAGALDGALAVLGPDATAGPAALIPVTVRTPLSPPSRSITVTAPTGGVARVFIPADSGLGVQADIATLQTTERANVSLHEPGGMPFRDGATAVAAAGDGAASFDIAANDVVTGLYELDVVAGPIAPVTARITTRISPLRLGVSATRDSLAATAANVGQVALNVRLRAGLLGAARVVHVTGQGSAPVRIVLPVPAWANHLNVDTRMAPIAWSRFTDFGVSFLDRRGHEFDVHPINYAFSRAAVDLPDSLRGDSLVILLTPGFADPGDHGSWTLDVDTRYYVEKPYSLDAGGSPVKPVAAGAIRRSAFARADLPIVIPAEFLPLVTVVALEGEDHIWARELILALPSGTPR
jgi:subtilisin family serine protease